VAAQEQFDNDVITILHHGQDCLDCFYEATPLGRSLIIGNTVNHAEEVRGGWELLKKLAHQAIKGAMIVFFELFNIASRDNLQSAKVLLGRGCVWSMKKLRFVSVIPKTPRKDLESGVDILREERQIPAEVMKQKLRDKAFDHASSISFIGIV